jgi:glutaryl-CoA dehydrogenase
MATSREQTTQEQQLPPPDGDFYGIVGTLSQEDRSLLSRVRAFMEEKVAPIINDYWMRDEFPFDVLPAAMRTSASPAHLTRATAASGKAP